MVSRYHICPGACLKFQGRESPVWFGGVSVSPFTVLSSLWCCGEELGCSAAGLTPSRGLPVADMLKWFPFVRLLSPRRAKPAGNSNDTGGEESDLEKMKQVNVLTSLLRATEVQQASRFQVNRLNAAPAAPPRRAPDAQSCRAAAQPGFPSSRLRGEKCSRESSSCSGGPCGEAPRSPGGSLFGARGV